MFLHFTEEAVFNLFILHQNEGGKKRFLKFKLKLIQSILGEAHVDLDASEPGHNKHNGDHYPESIPPTEKKDKPQK